MQHRVGRIGPALGADFARRRAEERQELRRPTPDIFVREAWWLQHGCPAQPWLWDRLVRSRLILTPDRQAGRLPSAVRFVYAPLFCSVSGSTTRTTPSLRL